jgi:hypothetical protein
VPDITGGHFVHQAESQGYRGTHWTLPKDAWQEVKAELDRRGDIYAFQPVLASGPPPQVHTSVHCFTAAQEQAEYDLKWPKHCETCNGSGTRGNGRFDYDTGSVDIDPCEDCESAWQCPRCGIGQGQWEGTLEFGGKDNPCLNCGWTGVNPGDCGPQHECECFQTPPEWWPSDP